MSARGPDRRTRITAAGAREARRVAEKYANKPVTAGFMTKLIRQRVHDIRGRLHPVTGRLRSHTIDPYTGGHVNIGRRGNAARRRGN